MKGVGGVLIITMKRGGLTLKESLKTFSPGLISLNSYGFHKTREFYSPTYNESNFNKPAPDLRTTIYWKPQVITGEDGKTEVEFFNSDGTGNYKVIVEGINEAGNIGRSVYRYNVK